PERARPSSRPLRRELARRVAVLVKTNTTAQAARSANPANANRFRTSARSRRKIVRAAAAGAHPSRARAFARLARDRAGQSRKWSEKLAEVALVGGVVQER